MVVTTCRVKGNVIHLSNWVVYIACNLSRPVYPPRLTPIAIGAVGPRFAAHKEGQNLFPFNLITLALRV